MKGKMKYIQGGAEFQLHIYKAFRLFWHGFDVFGDNKTPLCTQRGVSFYTRSINDPSGTIPSS